MLSYGPASFALVALLTAATTAATMADLVPAQSLEHPEGISLRDESVAGGNHGFFIGYASGRSHQGGGLLGGK